MQDKRTQRSFSASDILALIDGARFIHGFNHKQIARQRAILGLNKASAAPTGDSLTLMKQIAGFGWCAHRWQIQSRVTLPATDASVAQVFSATQVRHCSKCGCAQSRMWTANGYATKWLTPELPLNREASDERNHG